MEYQVLPMGDIWSDGIINVPKKVALGYVKMASEYQLKALLLILANNGKSSSLDIAKSLGCTEQDVDNFLDFWVSEGVLAVDGAVPQNPAPAPVPEKKEAKPKKKKEVIPIPVLNPSDIVRACNENPDLTVLMQSAQEVWGGAISHLEQELIVNMVNYYGLPCEIVLVILQYAKNEKSKGRAIGTAYISSMAKDWSEKGITTLAAADEMLTDLENSDRMWNRVIDLAGIRHRMPTQKQRAMVKAWGEDFSIDMIALACDQMKEYTEKPTLKYVDSVLKNWKKKGITTPQMVEAENQKFDSAKQEKNSGKLQSAPNFDIDEITNDAMFNDNYDI